jgi:RNA binding exosome subunit
VIHLRFDKQEAYRGRLVLGERDAVKVEVRRVRA